MSRTNSISSTAPVTPPATQSATGPATGPILDARGVTKSYGLGEQATVALRGVDLTVGAGELVAIMGPSGSGKTTLLNCLSGLDEIDSGSIVVDGQPLHDMDDGARTSHRAEAMGFIFQAFNLIPVFTAVENTELPLLLAGRSNKEARASAIETLERVGLGHRLSHRPGELSGGEQQRVAIARALAGRPKIVWADEPTGNLDSETAGQVLGLLRELHASGLTVVLVTHDEGIGASAQRRVLMRDGEIVGDERAETKPKASPAAQLGRVARNRVTAKKVSAKKAAPKKRAVTRVKAQPTNSNGVARARARTTKTR